MFWHNDSNGSCFGSYPESTRWQKNINADELMDAFEIKRIENLGYALSRLAAHDDIERLKAFCEKNDINYEYIVEDTY